MHLDVEDVNVTHSSSFSARLPVFCVNNMQKTPTTRVNRQQNHIVGVINCRVLTADVTTAGIRIMLSFTRNTSDSAVVMTNGKIQPSSGCVVRMRCVSVRPAARLLWCTFSTQLTSSGEIFYIVPLNILQN